MPSEPKEKNPIPEERSEEHEKSAPMPQVTFADWMVVNNPGRVKLNLKTGYFVSDFEAGRNAFWTQFGSPVHLESNLNFPATESAGEHEEHEKTREFVAEKLEYLAKKQDIIETKEEIIKALKNQIADLERRVQTTTENLVKTQDLEAATNRVCEEVKRQSEKTCRRMSEELANLREYLSKFAPHRRFFKVTFGFLCFFSAAVFINSVFGIRIIEPFWGAIGIALTAAMLVVIYFGMKDTRESLDRTGKF